MNENFLIILSLLLIIIGLFLTGFVIGNEYGKSFNKDNYILCLESGGSKTFCEQNSYQE